MVDNGTEHRQVRIQPAALRGSFTAPASKSHAHRLLIAAALGDRPCTVENAGTSADIEATLGCLRALGAGAMRQSDAVRITPLFETADGRRMLRRADGPAFYGNAVPLLDCGESGSTLRFFVPVAAALRDGAAFCGSGRLNERPLAELIACLRAHGVSATQDHTPFSMSGRLTSGVFTLPGNVSSQYITGLLFALPLLSGDSAIKLTTPLSSAGYVALTVQTLRAFGVSVTETADGFLVPGGQRFRTPQTLRAEGDWSGAAFFLAAGAVSGPITVTGLNPASLHRDRAMAALLQRFGAEVQTDAAADGSGTVTVRPGRLRAIRADLDEIPDLALPLAAVAAFAEGESVFTGCGRLRLKESDRLQAILTVLRAFGIRAAAQADELHIWGGKPRGAAVDSFNDHRVAMMAAVLAAGAEGPTVIDGADCVSKSYPAFFEDYRALGGVADGI